MIKKILLLSIFLLLISVSHQFEDVDGIFDSLKAKAKGLIDQNKDKIKNVILEKAKEEAMSLAKSKGPAALDKLSVKITPKLPSFLRSKFTDFINDLKKKLQATDDKKQEVVAQKDEKKNDTVAKKQTEIHNEPSKEVSPKRSTPKKSTPKRIQPKRSTPKKSTPKKSKRSKPKSFRNKGGIVIVINNNNGDGECCGKKGNSKITEPKSTSTSNTIPKTDSKTSENTSTDSTSETDSKTPDTTTDSSSSSSDKTSENEGSDNSSSDTGKSGKKGKLNKGGKKLPTKSKQSSGVGRTQKKISKTSSGVKKIPTQPKQSSGVGRTQKKISRTSSGVERTLDVDSEILWLEL